MISNGRNHCKYDMHIYFHVSFPGIAFIYKSFNDDNDCTAQSVCKNSWLFVCLYKSLPSTCFVVLYYFLLMCNAFVICLNKQNIFFLKSCVDFEFISLIHSFVYMHISLCYQELFYKTPVISLPFYILYSKNHHHAFI